MTAAAEVGPPITRTPRTMVAVTAALDAVALRIDEAGVRPDQVIHFAIGPYDMTVGVQLGSGEVAAFEALVALFPRATREPYEHEGTTWLRAKQRMADGSAVQILVDA